MKLHCLKPISIDGTDYAKGTHEVSDDMGSHWYLLACVADGTCAVGEAVTKQAAPAPAKSKPTHEEMGGSEYAKMMKANESALSQKKQETPSEEEIDAAALKRAAAQAKRKATLEAKKASAAQGQ